MLAGALLLGGCSASPTSFEPQHKTETEVINITDGMFPQVIDKNITYVQNEKDGT
jgi:PBP1b-binding outer membrane lipoprotein LpoB